MAVRDPRDVTCAVLSPILELVIKHVEQPGPKCQTALPSIELILQLVPALALNKYISVLCNRLLASNLSIEGLVPLLDLFIRMVSMRQFEELLINSNLLRGILGINCFVQSSEFNSYQFYHQKRSEISHVAFCRLLILVTGILSHFKNTASILNFAISFLAKFQARVDILLGLNFQPGNQEERFEVSLQFRNLNYLTEVSLLLQALAVLARNAEYWRNRNAAQFNRILFYICFRTTRLFATEQPATKNSTFFRAPPSMALADRIPAVSTLEESLQRILLSEATIAKGGPILSGGSVRGGTSDFVRFRELKATYLGSGGAVQNLFVYHLETVGVEALAGLAQTLIPMLETADVPQLIADPSQSLFDEDLFRRLAPSLVDHQLHLLYAYQKLQYYPESYREAQLRSYFINNSAEASHLSTHSSQFTTDFSVRELMHVVRKSLEMFFYLQVLTF